MVASQGPDTGCRCACLCRNTACSCWRCFFVRVSVEYLMERTGQGLCENRAISGRPGTFPVQCVPAAHHPPCLRLVQFRTCYYRCFFADEQWYRWVPGRGGHRHSWIVYVPCGSRRCFSPVSLPSFFLFFYAFS